MIDEMNHDSEVILSHLTRLAETKTWLLPRLTVNCKHIVHMYVERDGKDTLGDRRLTSVNFLFDGCSLWYPSFSFVEPQIHAQYEPRQW